MYISTSLDPHLTYFFLEHDDIEDMLWMKRNDWVSYSKAMTADPKKRRTTTLVIYKCDFNRFVKQLYSRI